MSSIRLDIKVCIGTFDIVLEGPSRLAWHLAVSLCSGCNIRGNVESLLKVLKPKGGSWWTGQMTKIPVIGPLGKSVILKKKSKGVELGLWADLVRILAHRAGPSPQDRRRQLAARQADRQTRSGAFALQNAVGI